MNAWWSWVLTIWGVASLILAGRRKTAALGWAVGLSVQLLWIAYALATKQWGFIFSALACGAACARNWFTWRREGQEAQVNS